MDMACDRLTVSHARQLIDTTYRMNSKRVKSYACKAVSHGSGTVAPSAYETH